MAQITLPLGELPATGYVRQSQLIPAIVPFSSATLWRNVKKRIVSRAGKIVGSRDRMAGGGCPRMDGIPHL